MLFRSLENNSKTVDGVTFTKRFKTGGNSSSTDRLFKFTVAKQAKISVLACASGASGERFALVGTGAFDKNAKAGAALGTNPEWRTWEYTGTEPQEIYVGSVGGVNFYAIKIEIEEEGTPGIPAAPISWSESKVSFKVRDAIPAMPVLVNEENLDVTFSSSNEALATVSETGVITVNENVEGAAIISATAGDGVTYKETVATCTIEVLTNKVVEKAAAPYETREIKMTKMLVKAADALTAGAIFGEDENLTVLAPYAAKVNNETATIFNREFTKRLDVRVTAEPTAEVPEGTEKANATSLVFKPTVDLTLVVFGRRQSVEDKDLLSVVDDEVNNIITETHFYNMTATDGKQLRFANQADPEVMLDHEVVIDSYQSNLDYGYVASIIKLKAGEVYTAWGFNTTYGVMGIGYIIEPAAPVAKIEGNSVDWKNEDIAIEFELAAAHHQLYHKFIPAQASVEDMAKAVDHTGYELAEGNTVTVTRPGTLSVYAYDPNTDIKSEPVEIAVNDGTSSIDQIGADVNAPVEYFNLQGIRVDNPENGVFIRRQGTTVTKVVK